MRSFKVALAKSGHLAVLLPLYALELESTTEDYSIQIVTESNPLAYVMEFDDQEEPQVISAEFLEKHVEILGDL